MKLNALLLVFTTPFRPNASFDRLAGTEHKGTIIIISFLQILLIMLVPFYFYYTSKPQHLSVGFQMGYLSLSFVIRVVLMSVVTAILLTKLFKKKMRLQDSFAIISISTLPLIIPLFSKMLFDDRSGTSLFVATMFFGLLVSLGVSKLYKISHVKSLMTIFGILLTFEIIRGSLMGISM